MLLNNTCHFVMNEEFKIRLVKVSKLAMMVQVAEGLQSEFPFLARKLVKIGMCSC